MEPQKPGVNLLRKALISVQQRESGGQNTNIKALLCGLQTVHLILKETYTIPHFTSSNLTRTQELEAQSLEIAQASR